MGVSLRARDVRDVERRKCSASSNERREPDRERELPELSPVEALLSARKVRAKPQWTARGADGVAAWVKAGSLKVFSEAGSPVGEVGMLPLACSLRSEERDVPIGE